MMNDSSIPATRQDRYALRFTNLYNRGRGYLSNGMDAPTR